MLPVADPTPIWVGPVLAAAITFASGVVLYVFNRIHERRLRFIEEKRAAYAELLAAELEQRLMSYELARLIKEYKQHGLQEMANAIIGWRAFRLQYQGQLSPENEKEALAHDAETAKELSNDPALAQLVEATDLESVDLTLDPPKPDFEGVTAKLHKVADRKEEATSHMYAALATVRLLAPPKVFREMAGIFDGTAAKAPPTSREFLTAMDKLTDTMRKDLGLKALR